MNKEIYSLVQSNSNPCYNKVREDWVDGSDWIDVWIVETKEKMEKSKRIGGGCRPACPNSKPRSFFCSFLGCAFSLRDQAHCECHTQPVPRAHLASKDRKEDPGQQPPILLSLIIYPRHFAQQSEGLGGTRPWKLWSQPAGPQPWPPCFQRPLSQVQ